MLDARAIEPQSVGPSEPPELPEDTEADLYPVTSAQRRLWFLDLLEPGLTAYNLITTVDLQGSLDPDSLRSAVDAVVRRHDALRTFFAELDGSLWQVVLPGLNPALPVIDLSGLAEDRREAAARALADGAARAFDLTQAPLLRLRLLRLSASRHSLVVEIHHIVADGRSLQVFARDLLAFYAGSPSRLPPAGQFSSFAAGQAEARTREALEPGLAWWRERLAGAPSLQQLPTDRARPRRPSFRGAVERRTLEHASALAEVGRREGVTSFMTLFATWLVLLHRWSWRTDLLVGIPVTNRDRPELADAIGFFVDVVVIRVAMDGRMSFVELLRRVREAVLDAIAHQEVPLELVVDDLRLDRRLDHQPFLQVLFGLSEESGEIGMRAGEIEARRVEVDADESAKSDLSLVLEAGEEGLSAWLKYAVDLYDRSTARRLLRGYGNLLAGLAADPGRPCAELPMMDEGELQQVLREWSGARRSTPPRSPIHEIFRRHAERSPGAPALELSDDCLSYGELEARSNQLARVLAELGVGGESPVGICLKLSADFLVAVLAVLKAGGVYLPLDPGLPTARLETLIADAGARWAITLTELAVVLPAGACEPVLLDQQRRRIASASSAPFSVPCTPESLVYILYTSGSTGVPKGVAVPHRAIHRLLVDSDYMQLDEHDRVALAAHTGFDASTLEIWGALLNGGCLVHVPRELLLSPGEFFAHLAATRITMLWITKSLFDQMIRHDPSGFSGVRHLLTGGEALDTGTVRSALAHLAPGSIGSTGGVRLRNCYGPTENTTFTTVHEIEEVPERALSIPIGRPIRGTHVYLVDSGFRPVPAGVAGELYTGGEGLARGYVADPGLTAATFLPDPFGELPGERLYRTGDLARWRADGALEFLGRVDHQVKIHGFRIEPAEIEAELAQHPGVRAAAVIAREDEPGVKRLVAYVVPSGPDPNLLSGLRGFLAERLPSFLVPHAFVALAELPVNTSGKLDRDALPRPDPSADIAAAVDTAPRTPVERALAEIWKEVLQRPAVGIHDNFFQIGGDSILSIRLVARARQQGLEISPALLFEVQTIAGLAAALEVDGVEGQPRSAPPISPISPISDEEIRTGLSRRARLVDDAVRRAAPNRLDRSLAFYFTPGQTGTVVERVPARYRITPAELVLAALARILTRWARATSLLVDVGHPRGLLLLDLSDLDHPDACLAAVKEPRRLAAGPLPELLFVYRGNAGDRGDTGATREAHHAIGVAAAVVEERLRVEWIYDANLFHPLVLEGLMRDHASEIMALAEHCLQAPSTGYTASDFPLSGLDRDGLERLLGADHDVEDLYPLTPLQESMLAYSLGLPRSGINFEQLCYSVEGAFDIDAFVRAWELALERHPILRTAFLWRGLARPLQAVRWDVRLPFRLLDWRQLDASRQERRLARLLERDRARGFQLDTAPLLRLAVARVADDRAYVVFSFHHALLDGWSLERLDREVLQDFQALRSGAVPVSEPGRPYRDYIAWLQRQDSGAACDSFRALLGSFADPVEIPDAEAPERSEERRRLLSEEESAGLIRFARRHGITPGTLAQAAWGLWLGRAFRRDDRGDVVFGLTVSGRPADLPGVEEMLGLFIHNLPVRLRLDGRPLLAWLQELQAQVAKTSRLVPIPEAELQGLSAVPPSRRLYETLVVVENLPTGDAAWSGLGDLRLERVSSQLKTRHPLTLVVIPGERIELRLVHHVDRVPGEAARQMLNDVCAILLALPPLPEAADLRDLPEPRSARALLPSLGQPAASERPDLPAVLPRDLLELRLSQIAEEVLERRPPTPLGVTANLFGCGLDSVRLVRLARRLGEELGRDLPFAILFERPTVAGLAEWLRAGAVDLPWSPLVAIQTGGKRPAFFCVHPLAGNVIAFLDLASAMGEDQPFYALQAPGADGRQEPLDRLEDIAALYVEAVRRRQPRGPYRLGGYSFGGVVAFEMARQMYEQGDEIALLAILDTPAPSEALSEEGEEKDNLFWLRQIVHMRERFLDLDLGLDGLEPLNEQDRLRRVAEILAQAEVLPADADAALMRQLVRVSRAQYQAYIRYRPAGPFPGRITLLRSEELHPSEASEHLRQAFQDPAMGWGALSPLPVRVIRVPGDHVTLLVRPQVATVAARLREAIQPDS